MSGEDELIAERAYNLKIDEDCLQIGSVFYSLTRKRTKEKIAGRTLEHSTETYLKNAIRHNNFPKKISLTLKVEN